MGAKNTLAYFTTNQPYFWRLVEVKGPADCWVYRKRKGGSLGYGCLTMRDASGHRYIGFAHRVAFAITHGGEYPAGQVLHSCDNPPCCNPSHLYEGTQQNNIDDQVSRLRARNGNIKIASLATIISIREATGTLTSIGEQFGIHRRQVKRIKDGTCWSDEYIARAIATGDLSQ